MGYRTHGDAPTREEVARRVLPECPSSTRVSPVSVGSSGICLVHGYILTSLGEDIPMVPSVPGPGGELLGKHVTPPCYLLHPTCPGLLLLHIGPGVWGSRGPGVWGQLV